MFKKIGIPILMLATIVGFGAPRAAKAADVHFGVTIGSPVYTAPAPVYPYRAPYVDPYYAPTYVAPTPYAAPYFGYSAGGGWHDHNRDHRDWGRHESHENQWRRK